MRLAVFSLVILLAAASPGSAQTTGTKFGLQAGIAHSVLEGAFGRTTGFKTDYVAGAFLRFQLTPKLAFQPEMNVARQGAKNEQFNGASVALNNSTHLTYLNVPLVLKFYLSNVVNVQAGPQLGLLLSARQKGEAGYVSSGGYVPGANGSSGYIISGGFVRNSNGSIVGTPSYAQANVDVKGDYRNDLAICVGIGTDFKNGLTAAARFNYGVTNINDNKDEQNLREMFDLGGLHNRVVQLTVSYAFNAS